MLNNIRQFVVKLIIVTVVLINICNNFINTTTAKCFINRNTIWIFRQRISSILFNVEKNGGK